MDSVPPLQYFTQFHITSSSNYNQPVPSSMVHADLLDVLRYFALYYKQIFLLLYQT